MKLRHLIDGDAYAIYRAWRLGRYRKARRVQSAKPAGVQARQTASLPLYQKLGLRAPERHSAEAVKAMLQVTPGRAGFDYAVRNVGHAGWSGVQLVLTRQDDRAVTTRSLGFEYLFASNKPMAEHWAALHDQLASEWASAPTGLPYILCSPGTEIDVDALAGGVNFAVPGGDPLPATPPTLEHSALHGEWARMNAQLNTAQKSKWDEARNRSYALEGEIADTTGVGMFEKLFKR